MRKAIQTCVLLLCIGMTSVYASDNNCGKLSILITNTTNAECKLVKKQLNHGYFMYSSLVPGVISAHSTAQPFVLTQSVFGPDIDLTYQCGNASQITIHSQQDLCFLSAGNVDASVLGQKNMSAWSVPSEGSSLWNQHGSIHWAFE